MLSLRAWRMNKLLFFSTMFDFFFDFFFSYGLQHWNIVCILHNIRIIQTKLAVYKLASITKTGKLELNKSFLNSLFHSWAQSFTLEKRQGIALFFLQKYQRPLLRWSPFPFLYTCLVSKPG